MKKAITAGGVFRESRSLFKNKGEKVMAQCGAFMLATIALSAFVHEAAGILMSYALVVLSLAYATKGDFSYNELFTGFTAKKFIYFILASMLSGLAIAGGLVLLVIPGLIVMSVLAFVKIVAVDRDVSPREALRVSARLTRGHRWTLFGILVLSLLINIVGALCLLFGLLYTVPLTATMLAVAYRKLSAHADAPKEAEPSVA